MNVDEKELARKTQKDTYEWVLNHLDKIYPELNITISDMILNCHEMCVDDYIEYYKYFAGDLVIMKIKKGDIITTEVMPNRWGSTLELYAISNIYKVPICVFMSQKYDTKKEKCVTGRLRNTKVEKGVRFKLSEVIGKEHIKNKTPIIILWRKTREGGHYMSLYPYKELWLDEEYKLV